jgi:hypothetical protein
MTRVSYPFGLVAGSRNIIPGDAAVRGALLQPNLEMCTHFKTVTLSNIFNSKPRMKQMS